MATLTCPRFMYARFQRLGKDGLRLDHRPQHDHPTRSWGFAFESSTPDLRSVQVHDVTRGLPRLILDDRSATLDKRTWRGHTLPAPLNRAVTDWLTERGDSLYIFRFTLTSSTGQTRTFYQPTLISRHFKQATRLVLRRWDEDSQKTQQTAPTPRSPLGITPPRSRPSSPGSTLTVNRAERIPSRPLPPHRGTSQQPTA